MQLSVCGDEEEKKKGESAQLFAALTASPLPLRHLYIHHLMLGSGRDQ